MTLAETPNSRGGAWNSQGIIVFSPSAVSGLWKVAATGGLSTPLTTLDQARGEFTHRWPVLLADSNRFIYLSRGARAAIGSIYLSSLERPQDRTLLVKEASTAAVYSPARGRHPEYLYWLRQQALVAQPFDSKHERLSGDGVPVPGAEAVALTAALARSNVSVSNDGTILFGTGSDQYQLAWLDRAGKVLSTVGKPDRYASVRISPDGTRVAVGLADSSSRSDLWLLELSRAIPTRLSKAASSEREPGRPMANGLLSTSSVTGSSCRRMQAGPVRRRLFFNHNTLFILMIGLRTVDTWFTHSRVQKDGLSCGFFP